MTQIPSYQDIELLASDIASNGTSEHRKSLLELTQIAHTAGLFPGAAEALSDSNAPEIVRLRAFATIARNWKHIASAAHKSAFDATVESLGAQWNEHQDLRPSGDLAQLWASRSKLAELRSEAQRHQALATC